MAQISLNLDALLDDLSGQIARLTRENAVLRAQLAGAQEALDALVNTEEPRTDKDS